MPRMHARPSQWLASVMGAASPAPSVQPVPHISAPLNPLEALAAAVPLESLTISRDAMPHHYVARAVILDLQPSQMVAAICVVEDRIKQSYPLARRTGWRATCDGLTLFFSAWTFAA